MQKRKVSILGLKKDLHVEAKKMIKLMKIGQFIYTDIYPLSIHLYQQKQEKDPRHMIKRRRVEI